MSEAALHTVLTRVSAGVAAGGLKPLPQVAHSLTEVQAALRQMSQARHVGKVVVRAPTLQAQQGSGGAVAISGGMGTLGTQVASWLARHRHLHLLGRTGRAAESAASQGLALLQPGSAAFAAAVTLAMCDTSCAEDAASSGSSRRPLAGIIYAGGVLADGVLSSQTLGGLRTAFASKAQAAAQLGNAHSRQPTAFQLLFSSVAALLGSPGQANYSAANATLDAAAQRAQLSGVTATSVQWGAWAGAGMAAGDASTAARVERTGMALVQPERGLAVLGGLLVASSPAPPLLAATPFAWDKFLRRFASSGQTPPAFFGEFAAAAELASAGGAVAASGSGGSGRHARAGGMAPAERKAAVLAQVQDAVRGILGADIGSDEPLMAAGLDSLGAVELKNNLEARLGLQLPGTLVFDYPSVAALAGYLEMQLPAAAAANDEADEDAVSIGDELALSPLALCGLASALPAGTAVALVGMSSRTAQVMPGAGVGW